MAWLIAKRFKDAIDPLSYVRTIEIEHDKIHQGKAFETDAFLTLQGQTPQYLCVKVNGCFCHFKEIQVEAEKNDVLLTAFRESVITDYGETLGISNSNENFQGVREANVEIFRNPTIEDNGELIRGSRKYLPGLEGQGQTVGGGGVTTDWERILKPNTDYVRKIERLEGSGACRVLITYRWYEVCLNEAGD